MFKDLLSDTLKYGIGKVILKFFSILIVPIIAKNFPPDIFGEINIVTIFVSLFLGISVLGLDSAVGYYYYHGDNNLKKDFLGTSFIIRIFISFVIFILFYIFAKKLSNTNFLLKNSEKYLLIILGAAVIPFDNCMSFFVDLSRFLIKPILYNIANISKVLIYYILIVIFLFNNLTIEKILISILISSIIPAIFLLFYYKQMLNFKLNIYCLKKLLIYGLPLVPASIMYFFMNSANRFVLNIFTTLEEVGIYSLMNSISSIFLLLTSSIIMAWPPYAMIIAKKDNAAIIYAKITTILIILLIPLALIFWSISDFAILIFSTPIYLKGENIIILLIMQHILNLLYYCVSIGLILKEKTIYISIVYTIAAVLSVLISFPLCKYFGIFGAAISSFIGFFISTQYVAFKSNHFYKIPYNTKFIFIYIFLILSILFLLLFLNNSNIIFNFLIRFSIGCVFLIIPFIFKIFKFSEIKLLFINE